MNQNSRPVPKVVYASLGSLIVSVIITIFMKWGWTYNQAVTITPAVIDAVYILGPPIATFVFGYFKTDTERQRLIEDRDILLKQTKAERQRVETLEEYLSSIKQGG